MGKALFTPVSIIAGLLAGILAGKLFEAVWGLIDDDEAPGPEHRDVPWAKLLAALAVQGAIMRIVKGLVDRGSRQAFYGATGAWPGEDQRDQT